ncbi:uncharacterized protein BYT42DRAFT_644854 [Radiomyces spectabilis]|uniref:uncharacterized protein n=1 Tax=Radiomyces spectabilis TaxID=64574 RepID=UPI002220D08F|nr:uncharacterized protein BYT42DRAFT_644854 [Radiomyces spectabilis]KAI8379614.1 hypothetical protein BYT42DRAFT_644854 [Radiomyces spectabilis]
MAVVDFDGYARTTKETHNRSLQHVPAFSADDSRKIEDDKMYNRHLPFAVAEGVEPSRSVAFTPEPRVYADDRRAKKPVRLSVGDFVLLPWPLLLRNRRNAPSRFRNREAVLENVARRIRVQKDDAKKTSNHTFMDNDMLMKLSWTMPPVMMSLRQPSTRLRKGVRSAYLERVLKHWGFPDSLGQFILHLLFGTTMAFNMNGHISPSRILYDSHIRGYFIPGHHCQEYWDAKKKGGVANRAARTEES